MLGEMATGDLQGELAPKENARDGAGLLRVELQVVTDAGEREGDIGAVDEGDGVHDEGDGDNPRPASGCDWRGEVATVRACHLGRGKCTWTESWADPAG